MSHHYISISSGKICISFADDRDTRCEFHNEQEAADALADRMLRANTMEIMLSSSVDFPEDEGLPEFNYDDFHHRVKQSLNRILLGGPRG